MAGRAARRTQQGKSKARQRARGERCVVSLVGPWVASSHLIGGLSGICKEIWGVRAIKIKIRRKTGGLIFSGGRAEVGGFAIGESVAEIGASGFGMDEEFGDDSWMVGGDVFGFGRVGVEIVEFGLGNFYLRVFRRDAVCAAAVIGKCPVSVRENEFPLTVTREEGLEFVGVVVAVVGV